MPFLAAWVAVAKGSFCSTQLRHSWLHDSALEQVLNGNLGVAWEGSASVVMRDEGRNERSSGGHRSGSPPAECECRAYLDLLRGLVEQGAAVRGVLLYGLARKSYQPEAAELAPLPEAWMRSWASRIEETGLEVRLFL